MSGGGRLPAAVAILACLGGAPGHALEAAVGQRMFHRAWVPAPSSTRADDGLGPHFDARSCAACHPGLARPRIEIDARGGPLPRGMVVRAARADGSGDPVYGRQIQSEAVIGVRPEAEMRLGWNDGPAAARSPRVVFDALGHGPLAADTRVSLRLAPPLGGTGAIEDVSEAEIRAEAARQARETPATAGRIAETIGADGRVAIGRFGFKAEQPTLAAQTAQAFATDMGMSSRFAPGPAGDCTAGEGDCVDAPHGAPDGVGPHEIDEAIIEAIVAWLRSRPVARPSRPAPPEAAAGAAVFTATGCADCHVPRLGGAALHSDLLLHDLGEGLSSGAPSDGRAAREWRTAPLAGLGRAIEERRPLLHDGRAETADAAIRRHGGQATGARARYLGLTPRDRRALLDYLSTL